jgi:uncharacterized protein involved in oxidation of intracellular sulfur
MKTLIVIHDAPYGNEKAYNALRHAMTLQAEHKEVKVAVFLMADAVACAAKNQKTPQGYYNIERMVSYVIRNGGDVKLCGTCMDARGMDEHTIIEGALKSTMSEFTKIVLDSDRVISF